MPVLCGNYPETTLYKYGSIPQKWSNCHEMAMRIALFSISSASGQLNRIIDIAPTLVVVDIAAIVSFIVYSFFPIVFYCIIAKLS